MTNLRDDLRQLWRLRVACLGVFGLAILIAWALSLPLVSSIRASPLMRVPDAGRCILEPGGLMLLELLRLSGDALGAAFSLTSALAAGLMLLSPLAIIAGARLLFPPNTPARPSLVVVMLRSYPNAIGISVAVWGARFGVLFLSTLLAGALRELVPTQNEQTADFAGLLAVAAGTLLLAATPLIRDLAILHTSRARTNTVESLAGAVCALGRHWKPLLARQLLFQGTIAACVLLGLYAPSWFSLARSDSIWNSLALLLTSQGLLLIAVVCRALCIQQAIRSLDLAFGEGARTTTCTGGSSESHCTE